MLTHSTKKTTPSGFTLIELAIVLALIALIISGGLSYTIAKREQQRHELTESKIDFITKSIEAFVKENGYIPCPSDPTLRFSEANFGFGTWSLSTEDPTVDVTECNAGNIIEKDNGGAAENVFYGAVPVYSLNIPPDYIYDGWNRRFTYIVDEDMTHGPGYIANEGDIEIRSTGYDGSDKANPITYRHANQADIDAGNVLNCDSSGSGFVTALGECALAGAPIAIISHGSNGFGTYSAAGGSAPTTAGSKYLYTSGSNDEDENTNFFSADTDNILIQSIRRGDFDDIVRFRMKWQLDTE